MSVGAIPGLSDGSPTDTIKSQALNITKVMVALATAIGALTAVSGAQAPDPKEVDGETTTPADAGIDLFGFSQRDRMIIVVALIAAAGLVVTADLLARAISAAKATVPDVPDGGAVLFAGRPATKIQQGGADLQGNIFGARPGDTTTFLFVSDDGATTVWAPEGEVKLRSQP